MVLDVVTKDTTDYSTTIRIVDETDGTPETGVVFNSAGIDLWYRRPNGAHVSITEVTQTEGGAHTDGGFVHISDGYYRLDLPDAAVATGADYVDVGGTVTGMVVIGGRIRLTDLDLDDGVRAGLTAMPNAAAGAAGGLPTDSTGKTSFNDVSAATVNAQCDTAISDAALATAANLATVDANVDAILVDTDTTIPALISALNDITTADILASGDVDGYTVEECLKLMLTALAGTLSGAATSTITITAVDGSKARLTATVDADGNRSAVVKDATG